jgi:hypothetical protein
MTVGWIPRPSFVVGEKYAYRISKVSLHLFESDRLESGRKADVKTTITSTSTEQLL